MLQEDIANAQKIVSKTLFNFGQLEVFHNISAIYKISNERIWEYVSFLNNKECVLSVIASGDQILNLILGGAIKVDAFDISSFPKYFLFLKMAAIKGLEREEYLNFFYGDNFTDELYKSMYDRIKIFLDEDMKEFWNCLFDFFEWQEIYNSRLFSTEPCHMDVAINQNKFLQNDDEYYKLRDLISCVSIRTYDGNIFDIACNFKEKYDLIYLSNIIYYYDLDEYKKMLSEFKLTKKGISITYLYKLHESIREKFNESNITYKKFDSCESGLMIYSK